MVIKTLTTQGGFACQGSTLSRRGNEIFFFGGERDSE
jgi:hypothetical protein